MAVRKKTTTTKSKEADSAVDKPSGDNGSLLQQLIPHWEEYQRSGKKNDLCRTVKVILSEIDEYAVLAGMESVSLNKKGDSSSVEEQTVDALMHFLDCAVGAVIDDGKAATEEHSSAGCIFELTAAVTAAKQSVAVCETVLARLTQFSTCDVEVVRVVATTALGHLAKHLLDLPPTNNHDDFTEILDAMQQAILPRFTDKAVAVRGAAVAAAGLSALLSDPDILQAVLWVLQHDPSPNNRCTAAQTLPVSLQTIDYLVHRLRDVKAAVRTAVLTALQSATITPACDDSEPLLQARHMADIVTAGYTDRCPATKQATRRLICLTWIKAVRYDPVRLLKCLDVLANPTACTAVVQVLQEADVVSMLSEELSDAEIRAFQQGMSAATTFSIDELLMTDESDDESSLPVERLFLARAVISKSASNREKDALLSKLVPDIPVLCQVLERFATKLVQALASADDDAIDHEEELIFICSELLQLATINAVSMEEGSRRVFAAAMKSMLTNILTPDDLIEGCVMALQQSAANTIDAEVTAIVTQLVESATDELQVNFTLRILSILTIVLETGSPSPATVNDFAQLIVSAVTHTNALVREAAVSCFGKLGFFTDPHTVKNDYKPTMLKVATDDTETMEIRAQAMLALADWSLLFADSDIDASFREQIADMMEPRHGTGTVCVAAEIAAKLLLTGKVCDSNWLARLVLIFFDEKLECDDADGDVKEVGSPVRLQQLLSVFFPALAAGTKAGRDALMGSISPILALVHDKQSKTKSRKALPVIKMIDFVVSTVEMGRDVAAKHQSKKQQQECAESTMQERKETVDDQERESSPCLLAAVQVATFLSEKSSDLGTTFIRALCKMIGGIHLVIDDELWEHLSLLKELLEELGNVIDDENCLRSMADTIELLADVEMEDEVDEEEDSDQESLADALGNIVISKGGENEDAEGSEDGSAVKWRDSLAESIESRRSRRLRPSN